MAILILMSTFRFLLKKSWLDKFEHLHTDEQMQLLMSLKASRVHYNYFDALRSQTDYRGEECLHIGARFPYVCTMIYLFNIANVNISFPPDLFS